LRKTAVELGSGTVAGPDPPPPERGGIPSPLEVAVPVWEPVHIPQEVGAASKVIPKLDIFRQINQRRDIFFLFSIFIYKENMIKNIRINKLIYLFLHIHHPHGPMVGSRCSNEVLFYALGVWVLIYIPLPK
jgi:hypothetical protein